MKDKEVKIMKPLISKIFHANLYFIQKSKKFNENRQCLKHHEYLCE
jgi:hypothetical protein